MANEPVITIVGNLTADPELRYVSSGHAVTNFTIASTPRNFNRQTNQWENGEAMFVRCAVWREYAENVAETLTKGMRVVATGHLSVRNYQTNEGYQRISLELNVDEIGPSLRYATAQVTRRPRNDQNFNNQSQGGYQQQQQSQNNYQQNSNQNGNAQGNYNAPQGGSADDPFSHPVNNAPAGGSAFDADGVPF